MWRQPHQLLGDTDAPNWQQLPRSACAVPAADSAAPADLMSLGVRDLDLLDQLFGHHLAVEHAKLDRGQRR
jgi:hypothetical protein